MFLQFGLSLLSQEDGFQRCRLNIHKYDVVVNAAGKGACLVDSISRDLLLSSYLLDLFVRFSCCGFRNKLIDWLID